MRCSWKSAKLVGWLALWSWVTACGDDAEAMDASASEDEPALMTLVLEEIALYDRRIRASCKCLVQSGTYANEQECLDFGLSGPDWAECATMALADYDSPDARAESQCYIDFLEETAECVETSECEEEKLAECGAPDADCLALQSERINLILNACPDFGLLSRLN